MRALNFMFVALGILGVLCAGGTGCAYTELSSSWMSPRFSGPRFDSFVVLGVSRDATLRRVAEDAFASQLTQRGIRAVPSYQIFPTQPDRLTREQIERAVKQQAVQGVIVARVARVEQEPRGGGGYAPQGFVTGYQQGLETAYAGKTSAYQYDVVTVDVQLYEVKSGEMIWSGVTRTFDPNDIESSTRNWAKVIIDALVKRDII